MHCKHRQFNSIEEKSTDRFLNVHVGSILVVVKKLSDLEGRRGDERVMMLCTLLEDIVTTGKIE
jgi:hypothetical protein